MNPAAQTCTSCEFENPRAWRACSRCGHPLGEVKSMTGRTYLAGGGDHTVVDSAPSAFNVDPSDETEASAEDQMLEPEIEPPLVGQSEATQAIMSGLRMAFDAGEPTLVVLEGERGSGKTRLLFHASEVAAQLRENVKVMYGMCRPAGADGYYAPWGRLLLERFGVTPSSSPTVVRGQMTKAVAEALRTDDEIAVGETTHLLGHLAGVPFPSSAFLNAGEDPAELRSRAAGALTDFLEGCAAQQPLLILLDNMQGAEDDGWELVEAALLARGPIAVIAAGNRPVAERTESIEAPGGKAVGPIAPLNEADVAAFLRILLPTLGHPPEPVVAAVTHRSSGNPSAVRELIFALVEAKLFHAIEGGMSTDVSLLETGELPVSMDDALRARLTRLDPLERATLERASIVGEVFADRCILALMRGERQIPGGADDPVSLWPNDDDAEALGLALARLEEKGFIQRAEQPDIPGAVEYRFLHPDTQGLLYEEHEHELRVTRHRTVAVWLSTLIEAHAQQMAAFAAPHFEKAGMNSRAGAAYLAASRAEQARMQTQAALRHAEKALDLLGDEDIAARLDAQHALGSLLTTLGQYDDAHAAFANMLVTAWRVGARNKGGAALNRIGRIHRQRGEDSAARRVLERALTLFRAAGDLRGVASTLDDLAQVALLKGELELAIGAAREALELRRSHADVRGESVSLMTMGRIEYAGGRIEAAEQLFASAREIRELIGDRPGVVQVYNALGAVAFDRGDTERAQACWHSALSEARQIADRNLQTMLLNNLGEALRKSGQLDESEQHLREARELAHGLRNRRAMAEVERNLGLTALRQSSDEAEPILMRALALAEEYGSKEAIGLAHRAVGALRAQTLFDDKGEVSRRAEESYLASIDTFREVGNEMEAARSLAQLGQHLVERGDLESAKERLREARAIMRRIGIAELEKVEQTLDELGVR